MGQHKMSRLSKQGVSVAFTAVALLGAPVLAEGGKAQLTVDEAVQEALAHNDQANAARARSEAASAQAKSVRGHLLPGVHVSEEFQHYSAPFDLPFGAVTFRARDQNTNTFV